MFFVIPHSFLDQNKGQSWSQQECLLSLFRPFTDWWVRVSGELWLSYKNSLSKNTPSLTLFSFIHLGRSQKRNYILGLFSWIWYPHPPTAYNLDFGGEMWRRKKILKKYFLFFWDRSLSETKQMTWNNKRLLYYSWSMIKRLAASVRLCFSINDEAQSKKLE